MTKQILIDSHFGLVRTAITEGGRLLDYYEESPDQGRSKGNIFRGVVKKVDLHIQAAFIRYGGGRDGFLPLRDMHPEMPVERGAPETGRSTPETEPTARETELSPPETEPGVLEDKPGPERGRGSRNEPRRGLKVGDTVLVQVVKDEVGDKGAALTTRLSLSGRYLVLIPGRGGEGGISSRITDEERAGLKKIMADLQIPEGGTIILRTAALNKGIGELQADLDRLGEIHREIMEQYGKGKEPGLVFREAPPALRYLREYYTQEVERIWVNEEDVLEQCRQFFFLYEPKSASKVVLSMDGPLMFRKLGLEGEVEKLSARKVVLHSGANIVIDQTEALVAIDVNSAKSKGGAVVSAGGEGAPTARRSRSKGDSGREDSHGQPEAEEALFAINKEAAVEIARQLRLRDLGGIIIVDFIDMEDEKHNRHLEELMRRATAPDKAKVKVFEISPLGIMQISRQRLRKAGPHFSRLACEACQGRGWHVSPAVTALATLRRMEERLQGGKAGQTLAVSAPYPLANQLLNEFREHVLALEKRFACPIHIAALPTEVGEALLGIAAPRESRREERPPVDGAAERPARARDSRGNSRSRGATPEVLGGMPKPEKAVSEVVSPGAKRGRVRVRGGRGTEVKSGKSAAPAAETPPRPPRVETQRPPSRVQAPEPQSGEAESSPRSRTRRRSRRGRGGRGRPAAPPTGGE